MEELGLIDPQLNERISAGVDLRTLFRYSADEQRRSENNFFQMQGAVYLSFQLDDRFAIYFNRGLLGQTELFGIGYVLPASGYFRVGRIVPTYGWKFADHTMYVRTELGFAPPFDTDVGFELGAFPGNTSLTLGVYNGVLPDQIRDGDDRFITALRAEWREGLGPVNVAAGGSWMLNQEDPSRDMTAFGPFGYLAWGPLSWLGEWDFFESGVGESGKSDALATSHELGYRIVQGFTLRGTYNFYDPDTNKKSGARSRLGLGLDTLITPFVGVLAMVNHTRFEDGEDLSGDEYTQAVLVLHFLY
jgi:hypothetical protein